jgi:hypothetical protein
MESYLTLPLYLRFLKNICFADYIDRITFQNQIWQFNEMSSLIKTMYNNHILHSSFPSKKLDQDVRFTKILTKYSTEYNNILFLTFLCDKMNLDKKDLLSYFQEMKTKTDFIPDKMEELLTMNITKLDIKRIFRFLEQSDVFIDDNNIPENFLLDEIIISEKSRE